MFIRRWVKIMIKTAHKRASSGSSDVGDAGYFKYCSTTHGWKEESLRNSFRLFAEGCTVPFIVRYRGEETYGLGADDIYGAKRCYDAFESLQKTRTARIQKLEKAGLLDPSLRSAMEQCVKIEDLDELWAPFKSEKKASAYALALAIDGMNELASNLEVSQASQLIVNNTTKDDSNLTPLQCIAVILVHKIGSTSENKRVVRAAIQRFVIVSSHLKKTLSTEDKSISKFRDYDNWSKPLVSASDHQILALRRGKESGDLALKCELLDDSKLLIAMNQLLVKYGVIKPGPMSQPVFRPVAHEKDYDLHLTSVAQQPKVASLSINRVSILSEAICEAVRKHLVPSVIRDMWHDAQEKADNAALSVYSTNLNKLLMTPPLLQYLRPICATSNSNKQTSCGNEIVVCGIDPGFSHGHKIAVVNNNALLETTKLYTSDNKSARPEHNLAQLCLAHNVAVMAVGDGVGSIQAVRLAEGAIAIMAQASPPVTCSYAVVSEAGASVYSASPLAAEEFPNIEISYLGAISIARRLIHPLHELVKVPANSLGVGMYQHDMSSNELLDRLNEVVEKCVSEVGVNINTGKSVFHLLKHVSGLSESRAKIIVDHVVQHYQQTKTKGLAIACRQDLLKIKNIGPTTYRNAAGFLRVYGGTEPLDCTSVHPELYTQTYALLKAVGFTKQHGQLKETHLGSTQLRQAFAAVADWSDIATKVKLTVSVVLDIVHWLGQSGELSLQVSCTSYDCVCVPDLAVQSNHDASWKLSGVDDIYVAKSMTQCGCAPLLKGAVDHVGTVEASDQLVNSCSHKQPGLLSVSDVVIGVIKNITSFGAFVDLGAAGLLSLSNTANTAAISDDVTVTAAATGEHKKKKVKGGEAGKSEAVTAHPKAHFNQKNDGLLHSSQHDLTKLTIGQKLLVQIKSIDAQRRRVGLCIPSAIEPSSSFSTSSTSTTSQQLKVPHSLIKTEHKEKKRKLEININQDH